MGAKGQDSDKWGKFKRNININSDLFIRVKGEKN